MILTNRWTWAVMVSALTGCAALSPQTDLNDLQRLTDGKTQGVNVALTRDPDQVVEAVNTLLGHPRHGVPVGPLSAQAAVGIALLNNPRLQASMAALGISDADRVQASTLPNPHLALGRFVEGERVEIERILSINVWSLVTLPWRAEWQGRQHELAKLRAAQDVVRLATDTRKAWIHAVAAQQSVHYLRDVKEAAEAGAELARRMARVGNWSRLQQAREQVYLADALTQLARGEQAALATREHLTRLMGLWGAQAQFTLPDRLPDLPTAVADNTQVEAQALRERLDVRTARTEAAYVAKSLGFVKATGYVNALTLSHRRSTTWDNASGDQDRLRGWEVELSLPLFDWGQARHARAQSVYLQAVERVRDVAVLARSEARESYSAYRTAHDVAQHFRQQVVPLRQFINDELVLRYNGMLASVWDLLADTRALVLSTQSAIHAQRDFWLAEADLQTVLTGTSPGALASLSTSVATGSPSTSAGH